MSGLDIGDCSVVCEEGAWHRPLAGPAQSHCLAGKHTECTANLYCICLSIPQIYNKLDAVQISVKF